MLLATPFLLGVLVSRATKHSTTAEAPELDQPSDPRAKDEQDPPEADFGIWDHSSDLAQVQVPMRDNDLEPSAHDTECIDISLTDLTPPQNAVTYKGM